MLGLRRLISVLEAFKKETLRPKVRNSRLSKAPPISAVIVKLQNPIDRRPNSSSSLGIYCDFELFDANLIDIGASGCAGALITISLQFGGCTVTYNSRGGM